MYDILKLDTEDVVVLIVLVAFSHRKRVLQLVC